MVRFVTIATLLVVLFSSTPLLAQDLIRGDADSSGDFDGLVDGLTILCWAFGCAFPTCLEALDADGDGVVNGLADAIYALTFQFAGGPPPPAPFPSCGPDPDPAGSVGCVSNSCP